MTRTRVRLRDTDRGFARLMRQLRGRFAHRLAVGVLERKGSARNRDSDLSVLAIAIVHEFGGGNLPERSFIRAWADERKAENLERIRRVARGVLAGKNEEQLLRAVGAEMVTEIRERMARGIDPPLKAATAAAKGTSTPLVGGQLARAIASEVRSPRGVRS